MYFEAGGTGITGTFNYERTFTKTSHGIDQRGLRFGIGLSPKYIQALDSTKKIQKAPGSALILVVGYNMHGNWGLSGQNPNQYELGINAVLSARNSIIEKIWKYDNKVRVFPSLNIGYRHQPVDSKGLVWRINYCPFYISSGIKHWIGLSFGYSFG
jgi:hypothetical protein